MDQSRFWLVAAAVLVFSTLVVTSLSGREKLTIAEMKGQVAKLSVDDRPPLCIHISERELDAAEKFYKAGEFEKANAALADVGAYAEFARDYAIRSHKHEKQSEIAIRKMVRKLGDLKHIVSLDEQRQVENTADRLQRVRDDLLAAMFPRAG